MEAEPPINPKPTVEILTEFHIQYKQIMEESMADKSIYDEAITKTKKEYDTLGITVEEQGKLITQLISQMAVAISGASMSTALELVTRNAAIDAQVKNQEAQTDEIGRESTRKDCLSESECSLKSEQTDEIGRESARKDCLSDAECSLKSRQEAVQLQVENTNRIKNGKEQVDKEGNEISYKDPDTNEWDDGSMPTQERLYIEGKIKNEECLATSECKLNDKKGELVEEQTDTESEKTILITRQKESFDDKNRQEAMKSMAGIASMIGTTGDIDVTGEVYADHKITVNNVLEQTDEPI